MKEIMNKYGKGYDYVVIDSDGIYWEEFGGSLHAVGEYGWEADIDDVCDIAKVEIDNGDKIVYIITNDAL